MQPKPSSRHIPPASWAIAFVLAFCAMAYGLHTLRPPLLIQLPLMLAPFSLMIPYVKSYERRARESGHMSVALGRYHLRSGVASAAYVILLFIAVYLNKTFENLGALAWPIASLPALAVVGLIWAMARYLIEEDDEYLRQRQTMAALIATGITLSLFTVYGFLENFDLVAHLPGWSVFPVWAVGLAIGQAILKVKDT